MNKRTLGVPYKQYTFWFCTIEGSSIPVMGYTPLDSVSKAAKIVWQIGDKVRLPEGYMFNPTSSRTITEDKTKQDDTKN